MLQAISQSINLLTDFKKLIEKNSGQISVATFMNFVLRHPRSGYYPHVTTIGSQGDFVTSPYISSLFGEVIGAWLVDYWYKMDKPKAIDLIELGPGQGLLLSDILSVCRLEPELIQALNIKCLEINPMFRQQIVDRNVSYTIQFYDHFETILYPQKPSFIIANEFFDALPVHQFQYLHQQWFERKVILSANNHIEFFIDENSRLEDFCIEYNLSDQLYPSMAKEGQILEINPQALTITDALAKHIQSYGGTALICDYGYTQPQYNDTVQAIYQHQRVELSAVLQQFCDITSHVDFNQITRNITCKDDLNVVVQTQRQFLITHGIMQRALQLKQHLQFEQLIRLDQSLHRLLSPEQMGYLFKVMSICKKDLSC